MSQDPATMNHEPATMNHDNAPGVDARLCSGTDHTLVARTCERLRRETRLQLQAMRQLLHALFDSAHKKG